jgi:hypothetical protein
MTHDWSLHPARIRALVGDGQVTEVRALQRGDQGLIITNPGDFDEITGRVWNHVTVSRKEPQPMTDIPTIPMTDKILRVQLPDGIGYVEIYTGGVNGPTGYPAVGVDVVSKTKHTDAADGRRYWPQFDHDCGVILVGKPGPRLLEQQRMADWAGRVFRKHDSGDHSECPDTCPAKES